MIGWRTGGHDGFEALSGAIALGEATPDERRRFMDHAADCARCSGDADASALVRSIRAARDGETWRPALGDSVGRAMAGRRKRRLSVTIAALSYATALSVALDLGITSGLGSRVLGLLQRPAAPPVAMVKHVAPVRLAVPPRVVPAAVEAPRLAVIHPAKRAVTVATVRHHPVPRVRAATGSDGLVDEHVLDGLPLDPGGDTDSPHVASVPRTPGL